MNHSPEMEWSAKWDWENFVGFGSKAIESPKKLQLTDWAQIVDDGEIDAGSFNLSGPVSSSAKSSVSASTDSSTKNGMQTPNFKLVAFEGFSGNFGQKIETKGTEISGTSEQLIGLGLGKRTYFENGGALGNDKGTSATLVKKSKSSGQNPVMPRCLVEGCNLDLSKAKEYHRKHRVCATHSKCPKVVIGGLERRFCQQCSRFHNLSEFDEKKRSCRRRLSDHNARRRKPQQETIQFNSTSLSSSFYGGRHHMSFLLNNSPLNHSRTPANFAWDTTCNSKFTLTKGYPLKSNGDGGTHEQYIPGIKPPYAMDMHVNAANGLLSSKSSIPEILNPGSKRGSLISPQLDAAAPEYGRALSLLSNNSNSWGSSCGPESSSVPLLHHHPMNQSIITQQQQQPMMNHAAIPDFWYQSPHHHHNPRVQTLPTANSSFQEIQLFKTPFEADFCSNILN